MNTKRGREGPDRPPASRKKVQKRTEGVVSELASSVKLPFSLLSVGPNEVPTLFFNEAVQAIPNYAVSYLHRGNIRYVVPSPDSENSLMRNIPVDQVVQEISTKTKQLGFSQARAIFKVEQIDGAPIPLVIVDLGQLGPDPLIQFKTLTFPQLKAWMDVYNVPYMILFRDNLNSQIIHYMSRLVDTSTLSTDPSNKSQPVRSALVERYQQISPTCSQFMYALFENLAARGSFMRSPFNVVVQDKVQQIGESDNDYGLRILHEKWIQDLNDNEYSEEIEYDLVGNLRGFMDDASIPDITLDKKGNPTIKTLMDCIVDKVQTRPDADSILDNFKSLEDFLNNSGDAVVGQNILFACLDNDNLSKTFEDDQFETMQDQIRCNVFQDLKTSVEKGACKYYVVRTISKVDRLTQFFKGAAAHAILVLHCTDTDKIFSVGLGYKGEMDLSAIDPDTKVGRNVQKRDKAVGWLQKLGSVSALPRTVLQDLSLSSVQALYTPDYLLTGKFNMLKSFAFDPNVEKRKMSYLFGKFVEVAHYGEFSRRHLAQLEKFASFINQISAEYRYQVDVVPVYTVKEKGDIFPTYVKARASTEYVVTDQNYEKDETYRTLCMYASKRSSLERYRDDMGVSTLEEALKVLKSEIIRTVGPIQSTRLLIKKKIQGLINDVLDQYGINNLQREYMLDKTIVVDNHVVLINVNGFYSEIVTTLTDPSCSADSPGNCSSFIEFILSDQVTCKNMLGISNPSYCRGIYDQKDCSDLKIDQDDKTVDLVRSAISMVQLQ